MTIDRISKLRAQYAHLIDPGMREYLVAGDELSPENVQSIDIAEQRKFYLKYSVRFRSPRPAGVRAKDFTLGEIPCRLYLPPNPTPTLLLFLHGGGLVLGDLETHDDICADLCAETGLEVMAVQYRLAPEHPFPAAFDDCWAVLMHILNEGQKVVISGNSSGAMLAAALCLKARDLGISGIVGQVLIVPSLGGDETNGSYVSQAHSPGLSTADLWAHRQLSKCAGQKYGLPLLETNHAELPPAFLVAAGLDPAHDDGVDYAAKLHAAGVSVELREEPLLVHDFIRARHISEPANLSFKAIVAAITRFAA